MQIHRTAAVTGPLPNRVWSDCVSDVRSIPRCTAQKNRWVRIALVRSVPMPARRRRGTTNTSSEYVKVIRLKSHAAPLNATIDRLSLSSTLLADTHSLRVVRFPITVALEYRTIDPVWMFAVNGQEVGSCFIHDSLLIVAFGAAFQDVGFLFTPLLTDVLGHVVEPVEKRCQWLLDALARDRFHWKQSLRVPRLGFGLTVQRIARRGDERPKCCGSSPSMFQWITLHRPGRSC